MSARETYARSARHFADFYLSYAQDHATSFEYLAFETANFFAAIDLYRKLEAWDGVVKLVQAIEPFLDDQGFWEELVDAFHVAIESAERHFWSQGRSPEPASWHNRITLRSSLSVLLFRRGEYAAARSHAEEALKQARRIKHSKLEALLLGLVGNIELAQGNYQKAQILQSESSTLLEKLGDIVSIAKSLHRQAILAQSQVDFEQAQKLERYRLELVIQSGDEGEIADASCALGDLAVSRGDYGSAKQAYEKSLLSYQSLNQPTGIAQVLNRMAKLSQVLGHIEESRRFLEDQLELERAHGNKASILNAMQDLAMFVLEQGELQKAQLLYMEAHELAVSLGNLPSIAFCLYGLGQIWQTNGELEIARHLYMEGLKAARTSGQPKLVSVMLAQQSVIARMVGEYGEAIRCLQEALKIERRLGRIQETAAILEDLGDIGYLRGKTRKAMNYYQQAQENYQKSGNEQGVGRCLSGRVRIALDGKRYKEGWQLLKDLAVISQRTGDAELLAVTKECLAFFQNMDHFREEANKLERLVGKRTSAKA